MASNGLWKLFAGTGDIRLYLLYREETAKEIVSDLYEKSAAEKKKNEQLLGDFPHG